MDIEVRLNRDEWNTYSFLVTRKANGELTEEEFVEDLMALVGRKMHARPQEGDTLRLVLDPKTQIQSPGLQD
jgi:polyphosphate kinase